MSQPKGYAILVDPYAPLPTQEWDCITCHHCNKVVLLKKDPGGFCRMCMKALCGPCADQGQCTPFEKKLEKYEKAAIRGRILADLMRVG